MTIGGVVTGIRAFPAWAPGTRMWRFAPPTAVAGLAAAAAGYVGLVDPNAPGHYPTCPFLFVTGYYCPGCGSLRAVHALTHGHLLEAVDRNPLATALLPVLIFGYLAWARRRVTGRPRRRLAPAWAIWMLLVVVIAFWILRNIPAFGWLAP
jgi:hypothetical protein